MPWSDEEYDRDELASVGIYIDDETGGTYTNEDEYPWVDEDEVGYHGER